VSNASASRSNGRLEFLDCLRGIAAFAVLIEHGGYSFVPAFRDFTHGLFSFGKFGLTAFFLVSGFVIPLSIERGSGLRRFWVQRFFRLYPLYWFSLAAALLLYCLGYHDAVTSDFSLHLWRNALVNLSMFQGYVTVPHAIGLYYTLSMEMAFYLACSILFVFGILRRSFMVTWGVLISAFCFSIGVPLFLHHRVEMAGVFYGVTLFVGTSLYRYHNREASALSIGALLLAVWIFTSCGIWFNYVHMKKADPLEHYNFVSVEIPWLAAYALFFLLYIIRDRQFPAALLWLGRISYSLYLLHPLVLCLFVPGSNITFSTWRFALFACSSLCLASATFLVIEQPMIRFGRQLGRRASLRPLQTCSDVRDVAMIDRTGT